MLRIATCVFIAMATVSASNPARAVEPEPPPPPVERLDWYLGIAGTVAFLVSAEDALGPGVDIDESFGLNVRAGRRGKWIAGELHYEWLDGFDAKGGGTDFEIDGWALTLDTKFYPLGLVERRFSPMARRFQPFATFGVGALVISQGAGRDDGDFALRLGGGLDVDVTKNIAINVDATYLLPVSKAIDDFDYVSVGWGVLFRF